MGVTDSPCPMGRLPIEEPEYCNIAAPNPNQPTGASGGGPEEKGCVNQAAERIEAGYTWINSKTKVYDELPFGGWKSSGYGKEHGEEAFDYYTETKSVVVSS